MIDFPNLARAWLHLTDVFMVLLSFFLVRARIAAYSLNGTSLLDK
jgi:hypothetical protein